MGIEDIISQWEKDSVIDVTDIGRVSVEIPTLHSKYLKIYVHESMVLKKIRAEYKKIYKLKWQYYLGQLDRQQLNQLGWEPFQLKILKQDIETYVGGDDQVADLQLRVDLQQEKVSMIQQILESINKRTFSVKNYIDWQKFQNGVV